jgi:FlaA1/EpsC-like NDP-sugar epimerase
MGDLPTSRVVPSAVRFSSAPWQAIRHQQFVAVAAHGLLVAAGFACAFLLRFDGVIPPKYVTMFWVALPIMVIFRLAALGALGVLRSRLQHAGMHDLVDLIKAVTASTLLLVAVLHIGGQLHAFPKSIIVLDWVLAIVLLGGARLGVRRALELKSGRRRRGPRVRTLVIGAGDAAEGLLRQLDHDPRNQLLIFGLVDDDPAKQALRLHGVRVLGTTEDLTALIKAHGIALVIFAIPSLPPQQIQRFVQQCVSTGVEFKIVPSLRELLEGKAHLAQLREVRIADLLGRPTIELELHRVRLSLAGRVVLITGGAGSIGSELARQIAACKPSRLVLVDQAESRLYFVHLELMKRFPATPVIPVICDVKDQRRMGQIFSSSRPDVVFHAAAYKHVPMMESNVLEAVRNNVFGTLSVVQSCVRWGVEQFVLISTDKAVRPSSVMGASKRIAERIALSWPAIVGAGTDFRAVRFGNVLDSDGSVVPLFRQQIAAGGPVTVTHADVTRYFMTIPEAVQLVLQASTLPEAAGRISLLEMGEPVRILELAENLIRLSGLEPYRDIGIVFTGMRPGEKLHEELMSEVELTVATGVDKIRVVQTDETDGARIHEVLQQLANAAEMGDHDAVLLNIFELVPECVAPLRDRVHRTDRLAWRWRDKVIESPDVKVLRHVGQSARGRLEPSAISGD